MSILIDAVANEVVLIRDTRFFEFDHDLRDFRDRIARMQMEVNGALASLAHSVDQTALDLVTIEWDQVDVELVAVLPHFVD